MKTILLKITIIFIVNSIVNYNLIAQNDTLTPKNQQETPQKTSEIMPEFPGGQAALIAFINKNIKYPKKAVRKRIEGTVYVKFLLDKTGKAVNFEIAGEKRLGYGLEEAAIEVLKKMPQWTPGYLNGKPVEVAFTIPIKFKIKQ